MILKPSLPKLFLGVDPGIATTGYGLVETEGHRLKMIDYGVIKTPANQDLPLRLSHIAQELKSLIQLHTPFSMAVEELFFNTNVKTALIVGQARGVILLTGAQCGQTISSYTPLQVKMAVSGYGRADKRQVQDMVKRLLGLKEIPKPDDAADALAVAICHAHSYKLKGL